MSTLACWGSNADGQVTPHSGGFVSVSAGWDHSCGLKASGSVTCWGDNQRQQCTCGGVTMAGAG